MRAIVYAPEGSTRAKLELIERHGGEIRIFGADFDLAKDEAERVAAAEGVPFFADGAEEAQYGGYAAIADEVLDQLEPGRRRRSSSRSETARFWAGSACGWPSARPQTLRIGVVAAAAPVMAESWEAGRLVERGADPTIADGLAVRVAIPYAVDVLARAAQRMLRVDERRAGPRDRSARRGRDPGRGVGRGGARRAAAGRARRRPGGADRDRPQHRRGALPARGRRPRARSRPGTRRRRPGTRPRRAPPTPVAGPGVGRTGARARHRRRASGAARSRSRRRRPRCRTPRSARGSAPSERPDARSAASA